jgi:hypothetical protein
MSGEPIGPDEFREGVVKRHQTAVDLHRRVWKALEHGMSQGRFVSEVVERAVDLLFIQAFKSHVSTYELATLALVEDAATIVRRSLELAVQTVYIAKDSSPDVRLQRAGTFLAFLWTKWPEELRSNIPEGERQAWDAILQKYGAHFTTKSKQWGPRFSEIFQELENSDESAGFPKGPYRENYSFLSNVAHGSPPSLVPGYAYGVVPIHDDRLVSMILLFSATYGLVTAMIWNELFHLMDELELNTLKDQALSLLAQRQANKPDVA